MRFHFCLTVCVIAAPGGVMAQDLPPATPPSPAPIGVTSDGVTLTPLPAIEATTPAAPPAVALPPPAPVEAEVTPIATETPHVRPPVLVTKDDRTAGLTGALGATAGGVAGGAAGAAVAGPVGKVAGGFLGKRVFQGLFGQDDTPRVTAVPQPPAAGDAGQLAADVVAADDR